MPFPSSEELPNPGTEPWSPASQAGKSLEFSSHSTFLSQHLTSQALLLTSSHITLLCCSNLNLADLFLFVTNEVPQDCLRLTDHLLTPCNDPQEISLGNVGLSWFTDDSDLNGGHNKYSAGCGITNCFEVVEATPLPMTTLAQ